MELQINSLETRIEKMQELFNKDLEEIQLLGLLSGKGNGNPLQYSCLENPMDGGA